MVTHEEEVRGDVITEFQSNGMLQIIAMLTHSHCLIDITKGRESERPKEELFRLSGLHSDSISIVSIPESQVTDEQLPIQGAFIASSEVMGAIKDLL
jgi:hypothetical protein